jgi:hypothetical protein
MLLESVLDRTHQDLAPSLRTPDDMVDHQVDALPLMLIFHVGSIAIYRLV